MRRLLPGFLALMLFGPAFGGTERGFWLNYDVTLKVSSDVQRISSRMRLPQGNKFPLILKDYRLDLHVSPQKEDWYSVEVWLYERTDSKAFTTPSSTYARVNAEPIRFEGQYQAPVELRMTIADIELDLAVAIKQD